jgi:hypothetical protein
MKNQQEFLKKVDLKVLLFLFYLMFVEFSTPNDPDVLDGSYLHGFTNFGSTNDKGEILDDDQSVDMIWFNGEVSHFSSSVYSDKLHRCYTDRSTSMDFTPMLHRQSTLMGLTPMLHRLEYIG